MNESPDPLDSLLDRWSEVPEPPPHLAMEVWQRLATEDETASLGWWDRLERWAGRPAFTVGFVAACALLGLFLAELHVSRVQRERNAELVRSYLLLIDPLLQAPPEENRS